jgi:hypothetical protein
MGSIFFSLVLILPIPAYLGIKEDQFFSDLRNFLVLVLCTNWCTTICITFPILHEIECNKFVCNKFVLVLVQIDLIQFENSNCIRSIFTKFDTNLLHTNLLHSILRKNWTISHKIGNVIQIVGVWLYGMEIDSYKSQIVDGVLVQKQNRTSRCLKSHASASQFFGTKCTHSCIPGLKGEALFSKLPSFFGVCQS